MSDVHPDVARPAYPPDWPSGAPWWMGDPGGAIYLPEERGITTAPDGTEVAWDAGPRVVDPGDDGYDEAAAEIARLAGDDPGEPWDPDLDEEP